MFDLRKRCLCLLMVIAMLATLLIPMVGPASASSTYSMSNVQNLPSPSSSDGSPTAIGSLIITMDPATAASANGQDLILEPPLSPAFFLVTTPTNSNGEATSVTFTGQDPSVTANVYATIEHPQSILNYTDLKFKGIQPASDASTYEIVIPLQIYVPAGTNGNVTVQCYVGSSSVLSSGSVIVATAGKQPITLIPDAEGPVSSTGGSVGSLTVQENSAGALYDATGQPVLSLTLPSGLTWDMNQINSNGFITLLGDQNLAGKLTVSTSQSGQELDFVNSSYQSQEATSFSFQTDVDVNENIAQPGLVDLAVTGTGTFNKTSITEGPYLAVTMSASTLSGQTVPTITSGKANSSAGEINISIGAPGSLVQGRTITLTLPDNVAWNQFPELDTVNSAAFVGFTAQSVGSNGNEISLNVTSAAPGPNLALNNIRITPAVDFSGDVNVTVGGSEGITGTVAIAHVTPAIKAAATSAPNLQIGAGNQALGDITITEQAAGALDAATTYSALDQDNSNGRTPAGIAVKNSTSTPADLYIVAPHGVTFNNTPTVTVTSGDLVLGTISTGSSNTAMNYSNQGYLEIPIQARSSSPSTITISGLQATLDNTVSDGPVTFKVQGTAADETTNPAGAFAAADATLFPNDTNSATFTAGNVGAAVSGAVYGNTAVFTIGSPSFTVNGSVSSMDTAPYIKDSRTFLPLRYVANALGVDDSDIQWNAATKTATIIDNSRIVKLTIGSTTMTMNGTAIAMDTAPEINNGRTCLPIAWVAQALGATVSWDATNQTVTIT